jgi:hypothetical protein
VLKRFPPLKPLGYLAVFLFLSSFLHAGKDMLGHEPVVPAGVDFIRSFDFESYATRINLDGSGAQSNRLRFRFRDPDVNAFVGMLAGFHHFNHDLQIGEPGNSNTAVLLANWGGAFGIVRGKHLWELDLMGANLSSRLGGAFAVLGEHKLSIRWTLFHRTEINIFTNDAILDADQGFFWMVARQWGVSAGYRWFTSNHMDRSGPHIGIRFYFESPKIPFIFPSLG